MANEQSAGVVSFDARQGSVCTPDVVRDEDVGGDRQHGLEVWGNGRGERDHPIRRGSSEDHVSIELLQRSHEVDEISSLWFDLEPLRIRSCVDGTHDPVWIRPPPFVEPR